LYSQLFVIIVESTLICGYRALSQRSGISCGRSAIMNSFPVFLQTVSCYLTFRREIKTFLFKISLVFVCFSSFVNCLCDFVKWPCSHW